MENAVKLCKPTMDGFPKEICQIGPKAVVMVVRRETNSYSQTIGIREFIEDGPPQPGLNPGSNNSGSPSRGGGGGREQQQPRNPGSEPRFNPGNPGSSPGLTQVRTQV